MVSSITFELKKQIIFSWFSQIKRLVLNLQPKLNHLNLQIMTTTSSSTGISRKDYIFSITIIGLFFSCSDLLPGLTAYSFLF